MNSFIARQPIFDRHLNVFAYELLFRNGFKNVFPDTNYDQASVQVITDSFLLMGMDTLTSGKIAFINITKDVLLEDYISFFPKNLFAVEILETVEPDLEVIEACNKLKKLGFLIVLDDFVYSKKFDPLVDLADIIKIDFLTTNKDIRKNIIKQFSPPGLRFLAEKVETQEIFQEALDLGYTYFQGHFFSKPLIVSQKTIPGQKIHYLNLIGEIQSHNFDYGKLEAIIKRDVSLSYKLLRYINSAFFGLETKIKSIRDALTLLGHNEVKKWASLVSFASMGSDKPEELIIQSIIRAKFCEALAIPAGLKNKADDLFLLGMFSLIDALIDRPMFEILKSIPIDKEIKSALLGENNKLNDIFLCVSAYENGDWNMLSKQTSKLRIEESIIPQIYKESIEWGNLSLQDHNLIQ